MKKHILALGLAAATAQVHAQGSSSGLMREMGRLGVDTALVVPSTAIDEYPLWSPDGMYIAANIAGVWYKFELTSFELGVANWHNQMVGVPSVDPIFFEASYEEIVIFSEATKYGSRHVMTRDGTSIDLAMSGMAVGFSVTRQGRKSRVLWQTGGENCHSLSLSTDESHVAFICELNGLFVYRLQ